MIPNQPQQPPFAPGAPPQTMPQAPPTPPIVASSLPLPADADLSFWKTEIERAENAQKPFHGDWQNNVEYYKGKSPDKTLENDDFVNVNVDFYQVEQKAAQLFYETPELQLSVKGGLILKAQMPGQPGQPADPNMQAQIVQAHRALINELIGDEQMDILSTVQRAIKSCLCVENTGPVQVGYQPTNKTVQPPSAQPGQILGLQAPVQFPIYQQLYALAFSRKKFLHPADYFDTDWDRAPWLAVRFRMPLNVARREFQDAFAAQPEFKGTNTRDGHIIEQSDAPKEPSGLNYVDGVLVFYKAHLFDPSAIHPELYRELVIIDGLDKEARHRDCPHQTIQPDGSISADSLIGNPIHPLTIRTVPDSAYVPSDAQMTRDLVKELCKFRTQMVQSRDANRQFTLYDTDKLPPETLAKIENRTIGSLIGVEGGALAQGAASIMATAITPANARQDYLANDYITRDIEKTLAIDATGAGVGNDTEESATKTATVDRNRSVRLDAERRQVLRWYLKLVYKLSALACRYLTPQAVAKYIGPQQAQIWAMWDKQASDGRVVFKAKPDSQIRLDAAQERRFALQLYQMTANDPNVVRVELLKNLFTKAGYDPTKMVVEQLPEKTPEPNISLRFQGDDLVAPQRQIVLEILAQAGYQITQDAIDQSAGQMYQQVALGLRDASGKAVPAQKRLAEHGGPAEPVRSLSKQQGDETGNRPGRPTMGGAA